MIAQNDSKIIDDLLQLISARKYKENARRPSENELAIY